MRKIILLTLFTLAIPALAFSQGVPAAAEKQPASQKKDEETIIKLHRDLMDAMVKKDRTVSDRLELASHVFINPAGGVEERSQQAAMGPGPTFESAATDELLVRVIGDTGVLTGRATVKGKLANGTDISGPYRFMQVFVKQKGEWRVAAASVVPIKQPAQPVSANPKN